ncbi:tetratricopeptide repeat protein [Stutzerimonas stutzeri]|uniref:Sel1 repeat family protein n=1 Tax=Stutzerimonas stutzeri TaxID=316 RepID=A0A2N8RCW6_STUST|nr:tetratricopeptide repeat protein [Stutzerimonas stutzeri]MCQ4254702.1 sel1 repeat family protein [Stutzerimonas stutzeri]PNF58913.1 hypothetical protein CXK99_13350 [Stutzerimonas stutzeri]
MRFLTLLSLSILLYGCDKPATFDEAETIYQSGALADAITAYVPLAEAGDYRAQLRLGSILLEEGEHQNLEKSASYFMKAADQGDVDALWHVGHRYWTGRGLPENIALAEKYLLKAAEAGSPRAMDNLGLIYYLRDGAESKLVTALAAKGWYRRAFQYGDASAARRIQLMHFEKQTLEDPVEAAAWKQAYQLALDEIPDSDPYQFLDQTQRIEARTRGYKYFSEYGTKKKPDTFLSLNKGP